MLSNQNGTNCQSNINDCSCNPCQNGGVCIVRYTYVPHFSCITGNVYLLSNLHSYHIHTWTQHLPPTPTHTSSHTHFLSYTLVTTHTHTHPHSQSDTTLSHNRMVSIHMHMPTRIHRQQLPDEYWWVCIPALPEWRKMHCEYMVSWSLR